MKKIVLLSMAIALCASCGQKGKYTYDPNNIKSDTTKVQKNADAFEIDFKNTASNVKTVHVKLNDANGYDALFDTGCSDLLISQLEYVDMLKSGTISQSDYVGTSKSSIADGSEPENPVVNIRVITFIDKNGKSHSLSNINATVVENPGADILIGNEIIDNLAKHSYEVDLSNKVIRFK